MAKITFSNEQARINIPKEIIKLKGWTEETEINVQALPILTTGLLDKDSVIQIQEIPKEAKKK